ncbi:MAG: DNA-directed RNA polymerase subunit alpha C-terminal domain-containing protein, partial [Gammaproteobacteria bacterium]
MTLYEMATGQLPTWGDGQSDPSLLACEVSLDSELFDPAVRAGLSEFFEQALARDYRARYDNAEEMRRAWFRVFEPIDRPASTTDPGEAVDIDAMLEDATEATPLVALGLSARILNALDRMGAHTLGELIRVPRIRLYRNKGIGQKTVREIRELAERVADRFARNDLGWPEHGERPVAAVTVTPEDEIPVDPKLWSVDLMAGKVAGSRVAAGEARLLKCLLGLDGEAAVSSYTPQQEIADTLGLRRSEIQKALETARQRWSRQPWMTALREDIARLVDKHAG